MSQLRQAIVVIHGIGEQKPMGTLRGFVDSVKEQVDGRPVRFFNKPDNMSEIFELRRLMVYAGRKYRSDFFEYYWAHNLRGTKLGHILTWTAQLMWKKPRQVPSRIRSVYFLIWIFTFLYAALFAAAAFQYIELKKILSGPLIALLSTVVLNVISFFTVYYLGDAARYTYPAPGNIADRQKIRSDGVNLLRNIHNSGKYDRIIVIGHSLGSMIAYDILKHLWSHYNTTHCNPLEVNRDMLDEYENKFTGDDAHWTKETREEFHQFQSKLRDEQCKLGNKWLVTDFVTLGSPLAYSSILMAGSPEELKDRIEERELPKCPPIPEKNKISYPVNYEVDVAGQETKIKRTIYCLHHAALFACTRWYNLYYKKDFVGGPLAPVFGKGIHDIEVKTKTFRDHIPFATHTSYWGEVKKDNTLMKESINELRKIIYP